MASIKKLILFLFVLGAGVAKGSVISIDPKRCQADLPNEARVYSSDFKWNMSLEDIRNSAKTMYNSEKRLAARAFYDDKSKNLIFPNDSVRGGPIKIPDNFIKAISRHVEKAFERKYIDAVLFPDMGHSHFLIPLETYKKELEPLPVNQFNILYEKIFKNKDVKIVYHTAEQLRVFDESKNLLNDRELQWRFFTRNLVGQNNLEPDLELVNATATSAANTMGEVSGYYWWGGGFNIHANKNGCFSFKKNGKIYFFDLSLEDLIPDPSTGGGANFRPMILSEKPSWFSSHL